MHGIMANVYFIPLSSTLKWSSEAPKKAVKRQISRLHPQSFCFRRYGMKPETSHSNDFPAAAAAAALETTV